MGKLIVHRERSLLELDGWFLADGDVVEVYLIGGFVVGVISWDRRGWYLTSYRMGIRLHTGLIAHLLAWAD